MSDLMVPQEVAAAALRETQLVTEVCIALLTRLGGSVEITADDLFVARRSTLWSKEIPGGGLALQLRLPGVIPPGPAEFLS